MKKRLLALPVVLLILAVTAFGAFADTVTQDATIEITAGSLSVSVPQEVEFQSVALDGTDLESESAAVGNTWTVIDATGSGAGWNLTISSTDFIGPDSHIIDISESDQKFQIQLIADNVDVKYGFGKPTSDVLELTDITGSPKKILTASAEQGMGTIELSPNFKLHIPAETYAGIYTAELTVTVGTGP